MATTSPPLEITRLHCERVDDVPILTAFAETAQTQLDTVRRSGGADPWRGIHPWTIGTDCSMPYIHYIAHTATGDVYGWMSVLVHGDARADKYAFVAEVAATVRGLGRRLHDELLADTRDTLDFLYLYAVNDIVASVYASTWGYERIADTRHMVRVLRRGPSDAFIEKCMKPEDAPIEDVRALLAPLHTTNARNRRFMHLARGVPSVSASAANVTQLAENVEIAMAGEETEEAQRAAAAALLEEFYVRRGVPVPSPRAVKAPVRLTYGPGWTQGDKGRRRHRSTRRGGLQKRRQRRRTLRR
jgi:hypothetical protein